MGSSSVYGNSQYCDDLCWLNVLFLVQRCQWKRSISSGSSNQGATHPERQGYQQHLYSSGRSQTWPAHWMPYSLQKWSTYSFYWVVVSFIHHLPSCWHTRNDMLLLVEKPCGLVRMPVLYFTGVPCMYILYLLAFLAFLAAGQIYYAW